MLLYLKDFSKLVRSNNSAHVLLNLELPLGLGLVRLLVLEIFVSVVKEVELIVFHLALFTA